MDLTSYIGEFVTLIIEQKIREVDISDGSRVIRGSNKHVKDLEKRIAYLVTWRDKERRGSDARANYSRVIQRLKSELSNIRSKQNKDFSNSKELSKNNASHKITLVKTLF